MFYERFPVFPDNLFKVVFAQACIKSQKEFYSFEAT